MIYWRQFIVKFLNTPVLYIKILRPQLIPVLLVQVTLLLTSPRQPTAHNVNV